MVAPIAVNTTPAQGQLKTQEQDLASLTAVGDRAAILDTSRGGQIAFSASARHAYLQTLDAAQEVGANLRGTVIAALSQSLLTADARGSRRGGSVGISTGQVAEAIAAKSRQNIRDDVELAGKRGMPTTRMEGLSDGEAFNMASGVLKDIQRDVEQAARPKDGEPGAELAQSQAGRPRQPGQHPPQAAAHPWLSVEPEQAEALGQEHESREREHPEPRLHEPLAVANALENRLEREDRLAARLALEMVGGAIAAGFAQAMRTAPAEQQRQDRIADLDRKLVSAHDEAMRLDSLFMLYRDNPELRQIYAVGLERIKAQHDRYIADRLAA